MKKWFTILLSLIFLVGCNNNTPHSEPLSSIDSSITHEHVVDKTYYKDENEHWFICKDCLEKIGVTSHMYDDEGFCDCGKSIIDLKYTFNNDKKGFAGGKITLSGITFQSDLTYSLYWADKDGELSTSSFASISGNNSKKLDFNIEDYMSIPTNATHIILYVDGETLAGFYEIDSNKLINYDETTIFASVSDVHTNYNQGAMFWVNVLNEYESKGVSYIIISGDIGESNDDYYKYEQATKSSSFKGLIFASLGNHDQTSAGRNNFRSHVCYDGKARKFISLDELENYFDNDYNGDLNVNIEYVGGKSNNYYNAIINNNLFIFMDQMLSATANTSLQDNFSVEQLKFVEDSLYKYSATHNLFIVEHAPITQFKVGDKYQNGYGNSLLLPYSYKNNRKFAALLEEYNEAIWLSGHSHIQFDTAINYINYYYDVNGQLTDKKMAHMVHNSSTAQARFYDDTGALIYKNDFTPGSEGYICVQSDDSIEFLTCRFKDYTPDYPYYEPSLFNFNYLYKYSFRIPLETKTHKYPLEDEDINVIDTPKVNLATIDNFYARRGTPEAQETSEGLKLIFSNTADRIEIKAGNQEEAWYNGYYLQFIIKTNITTFNVGGSNYSGGRYTIVTVNLNNPSGNYSVKELDDGYKLVSIPFLSIGNELTNKEIAIRFYDPNIAGYMIIKELFINKKED